MTANEYIALITSDPAKVSEIKSPIIVKWEEVYLRTTFHTLGIKPKYEVNRKSSYWYNKTVTPASYDPKYESIFEGDIFNRYPTISKERYNWQRSIYPTIAKSMFTQALREIKGALFQLGTYDATSHEKNTKAFLEGNNFNCKSLKNYIREVLPSQMVNDPNGFLVVHYDFEAETATANDLVFRYVSSEKIKFFDKSLLVFENADKSLIAIDANSHSKLSYNKKEERYYNLVSVPHNLSILTAIQLGGYYVAVDNENHDDSMYYDSFFSAGVELAYPVVRQFIDNESLAKDLIPIVQQVDPTCPECEGDMTIPVPCPDSEADSAKGCTEICGTCEGKGTVSRNMGDVYTVDFEAAKEMNGLKLVDYITPQTAIITATEERFYKLLDELRSALYLNNAEEAQSGVAKTIDQEKMRKFVSDFSNQLFEVARNLIIFCDALINLKVNPSAACIVQPTQFGLESEAEQSERIAKMKEGGFDSLILRTKTEAMINTGNSSDEVKKMAKVLGMYDPLRYQNEKSIERKTALGIITKNACIKSLYAENELQKLVHQKGKDWFMRQDYEAIAAELDREIQKHLIVNERPIYVADGEGA